MIPKEELMKRLPTDFGGLPAGRIERLEHELEPWEKRCHALADVLDFHKIINTEEKRRGVEALGSELIGRLSYYERWIVAFANILFDRLKRRARRAGAGRACAAACAWRIAGIRSLSPPPRSLIVSAEM